MKSFKKSLMALAAVAALSGAGSANAFLQNWYLDTNGTAAGGGVANVNSLGISGSALITNVFSSATNFTFSEAGSFSSFSANNGTKVLPNFLSSEFWGTGSGTAGVGLTFTSGALKLFDSAANAIGTFELMSGSASLTGANALIPNENVTLIFKATWLAEDYFFKDATKTVDLADLVSNPTGLLFGFATTNAAALNGSDAADAVAANQAIYTNKFGVAFDPTNNPGQNTLVVGNGGQFRFQVPEPGSLALIGLGLLGAGVARRRKVVAN